MRSCLLLLFLCSLATGCNRGPTLVPVTGTVTYNGVSIAPGAVFLEPDGDSKAEIQRASGLLQLDGSFKLRTYPQGNGAMPGNYRMHLQLGHGTKPELAKFTDVARSPLTVVVSNQGLKDYKIELADYVSKKQ